MNGKTVVFAFFWYFEKPEKGGSGGYKRSKEKLEYKHGHSSTMRALFIALLLFLGVLPLFGTISMWSTFTAIEKCAGIVQCVIFLGTCYFFLKIAYRQYANLRDVDLAVPFTVQLRRNTCYYLIPTNAFIAAVVLSHFCAKDLTNIGLWVDIAIFAIASNFCAICLAVAASLQRNCASIILYWNLTDQFFAARRMFILRVRQSAQNDHPLI